MEVTRGATPYNPKEQSEWQNGPSFLSKSVEEWPVKSAKEVAASAKEGINKLRRKTFTAALTRAQAKLKPVGKEPVNHSAPPESPGEASARRRPAGLAV